MSGRPASSSSTAGGYGIAASLSTFLMFGLGYFFADWIERGLEEVKHYIVVVIGAGPARR